MSPAAPGSPAWPGIGVVAAGGAVGTLLRAGAVAAIPPGWSVITIVVVNLMGAFWGTQQAARIMVDQGRGAIVNMSSAQAKLAIPDSVPYGISKAGISQMARKATGGKISMIVRSGQVSE